MARHGYVDDIDDPLELGRWRGRVHSAMHGKRGQSMLIELRNALDAMTEKRLVSRTLQTRDGDCCAIGSLCKAKGIDLTDHADDDSDDLFELNGDISGRLNVAECMIQEIEWINDECGPHDETPEQRWTRVRAWLDRAIKQATPTPAGEVRE
jgi:hypothetical protein